MPGRAPASRRTRRISSRLLGYFRIPLVVTLERPVEMKEGLPEEIAGELGALKSGLVATFEKDFFDLTKEPKIKSHLARLKKKQAIVAGCETDVCVLQSCLGLLDLGYEVYAVEELLFSSARDVAAAKARMQAEGVVFLSWKTLYFELLEAVGSGRHADKIDQGVRAVPRPAGSRDRLRTGIRGQRGSSGPSNL